MQPISQILSVAVSGNTLRGQLPALERNEIWDELSERRLLKEAAEPQLPRAKAHASAKAKSSSRSSSSSDSDKHSHNSSHSSDSDKHSHNSSHSSDDGKPGVLSSSDEETIHPDGLDCGDGTFVQVKLNHVHVQDFSASFNHMSKQEPLLDALLKSTEEFYSAFGPDAYRLTLVNGTDKNVNLKNPTSEHRFCNETYFDSHEFSSEKLEEVKSELKSIIYDQSRYWQNGARPDLLDAIYDIAMAADKEDIADTITIFTVGTDQCAAESCIYMGEQQPSFPDEFTCIHRQVPESMQESWAYDRRMVQYIKNCNKRDYVSLYELGHALDHVNGKVLWLVDTDANLGTMCQEVGDITVTDYYERRVNPFLSQLGQTSVTYNVSEGGDALSGGIIDGIKELVCHPPTTIAPPPDFLTSTTAPPTTTTMSTTAPPTTTTMSTTAPTTTTMSTTAPTTTTTTQGVDGGPIEETTSTTTTTTTTQGVDGGPIEETTSTTTAFTTTEGVDGGPIEETTSTTTAFTTTEGVDGGPIEETTTTTTMSTTAPPTTATSTTTTTFVDFDTRPISVPTTRPVISTELVTTGEATELIPCKPDCATKACGCCSKNDEELQFLREEVAQLRNMILSMVEVA